MRFPAIAVVVLSVFLGGCATWSYLGYRCCPDYPEDETETLIFSAGPAFEYSRTISTSSMVEFSSEVGLETSSEFSHEVEIKACFVAWGTGTEMNLASGSAASQ